MNQENFLQVRLTIIEGRQEIIKIPKITHFTISEFVSQPVETMTTELQKIGVFKENHTCLDCGTLLTKFYNQQDRGPFFRCNKRTCQRKKYPLWKNTIFGSSKLPIEKTLLTLYYFSCRRTVSDTAECLDYNKQSVCDLYKLFRSTLESFTEKYSSKLGGPGVVIHFDETPITKRHGYTGRHAPSTTVWVVGAVDIHSRKCFLHFLPSRSRNDLYQFIEKWILPGSTIHTDCHRSYSTLSSMGFTHLTVNHSRTLVSPDGTHTNWIEGLFGCVKKLRRKYDAKWAGVENLHLYLAEFCFRYRWNAWNRQTAFGKILLAFNNMRKDMDDEDLLAEMNSYE